MGPATSSPLRRFIFTVGRLRAARGRHLRAAGHPRRRAAGRREAELRRDARGPRHRGRVADLLKVRVRLQLDEKADKFSGDVINEVAWLAAGATDVWFDARGHEGLRREGRRQGRPRSSRTSTACTSRCRRRRCTARRRRSSSTTLGRPPQARALVRPSDAGGAEPPRRDLEPGRVGGHAPLDPDLGLPERPHRLRGRVHRARRTDRRQQRQAGREEGARRRLDHLALVDRLPVRDLPDLALRQPLRALGRRLARASRSSTTSSRASARRRRAAASARRPTRSSSSRRRSV